MARSRKIQLKETPVADDSVDDLDVRDGRRVAKALPAAIAALPAELNVRFKHDTPLFSADPDDPTIIVRKLQRKTVRGRFVNGKFVEIK